MKLSKEVMLLSVISIVFLAGCTSGGGTTTGAGVIITSFAPDVQEVDGGSDVTFAVSVKNVGGRTAGDIDVLLFGLSNEWQPPVTQTKRISITLAPADSQTGLTGEEGSQDWSVTAPAGKNSDITYDASARVFYVYSTQSDVLLRFVKADYLKTAPNTQKGIVSSSATSGPLVITVAARTPTISTQVAGRIQFEIQNVGGGRVFDAVDSSGKITTLDVINKITISGLGDGGTCSGIGSGGTAVFEGADRVRLAAGKSKVISCDINVKDITNFADRSVKLVAVYKYFVDSATQVKVLRMLGEAQVDTLRPTVVTTQPTAGETNVKGPTDSPNKPIINITFSEPMDRLSVQNALEIRQEVPGGSKSFSIASAIWSNSDKTISFSPATDLDTNTLTKVIIKATAKDLAANTLASDFELRFTTSS